MNWRSTARDIRRIVRKDSGQDLAEYGMLAAIIAIGAMFGLRSFVNALTGLWDAVANFI
jgi:Flp pilus assembly pilin Flp